jgi:AraC-like DNA-binding protein
LRTIACTEASDETLAAVRRAFPDSALVHVALDAIDGLGVEAFPGSLIVDPGALTPSGIDKLALIKAGWPWLGVVALLPVTNDLARLAFELGRARVDEMLVLGSEDHPHRLRKAVSEASLSSVACEVEHGLLPLPPSLVRPNVERVLRRITVLKRSRDFASALGVSLARLRTELHDTEHMPAGALLGWLRILAAARRLGDGQETVERIALSFDFASRPSFENACHRMLGVTPSTLRERGGLRFAGTRFRGAVREWRLPADR